MLINMIPVEQLVKSYESEETKLAVFNISQLDYDDTDGKQPLNYKVCTSEPINEEFQKKIREIYKKYEEFQNYQWFQ